MKTAFLMTGLLFLAMQSLLRADSSTIILHKDSIIEKARAAAREEFDKHRELQFAFYRLAYSFVAGSEAKIEVLFQSNPIKKEIPSGEHTATRIHFKTVMVEMNEAEQVTTIHPASDGPYLQTTK